MTDAAVDQGAIRAKALLEDLIHDRNLGPALRKRAKEKYPDVVFPEDHFDPLVDPLRDENKALKERLEKIEADRAEERRQREEQDTRVSMEKALDAARAKYGLTDEGFDRMVSRMKETKNFNDAEAAAAWVAQQTPPPAPPGPSWAPKSMNLFGTKDGADERWKTLHRDPQGYMDAELQRFVANPDAYMREDAA